MKILRELSNERIGELAVIASAFLWSLFPIFTKLSYRDLDPITALGWVTLFSLLFFIAVAHIRSSWVNIFHKDVLPTLLGVAFFNGILFYVLYFFGLRHTSAGNAGIIASFEVLFTFLFFNVWRKEFIDAKHLVGAVCILTSAFIIFSRSFSHFQLGDVLILAAVASAPLGNLFQKQLRKKMNSEQILLFRTLISAPILFILAVSLGETVSFPMGRALLVTLASGVLLFGLTKIFWVESIHRIGVTKAISLSGISPILTLVFAFLFLGDHPTISQLSAILPAVLGIYLLTRLPKKLPA